MVYTAASAGRAPGADEPGATAYPALGPAVAAGPAFGRAPRPALPAGDGIPAHTFIDEFERRIG
jgi:hypothetical protein